MTATGAAGVNLRVLLCSQYDQHASQHAGSRPRRARVMTMSNVVSVHLSPKRGTLGRAKGVGTLDLHSEVKDYL